MLPAQLRKVELARELKLREKSWKELKEKWRKIFLQLKLPEMKEDVQNMIGCIERWVEAKNYQICLLMEEIDEFHNQSNFISESHVVALDRLIEIYLQRISNFQNDYNKELYTMLQRAKTDFQIINSEETNTEENMKAMLYQMEMNRDRDEDLMNCEMFLKIDDEKSKNMEKREYLRVKLENKMEKIWSLISGILTEYQTSTEKRRRHFLKLRDRDIRDNKVIAYQTKKIQKLYDLSLELRNAVDKGYAPTKAMLEAEDLREEKLKFFSAFTYLKKVLEENLKQDENNLKVLINASNQVLEILENYVKKDERIVSLFAICRKLETEKEKVMQVGSSTKPSNAETENSEKEFGEMEKVTPDNLSPLENFWKKVAKVNVSRLGLMKYIEETEKENECLKELLLMYLEQRSRES